VSGGTFVRKRSRAAYILEPPYATKYASGRPIKRVWFMNEVK
jgi:hypothetical protein